MNYQYKQSLDGRWKASEAETEGIANTLQGAEALAAGLEKFGKTAFNSGACQGISCWWLIKRALGDDFWTWFGAPRKAAPGSPNENGAAGEPAEFITDVMKAQKNLKKVPGYRRDVNHSAAINYILARTKPHLTNKRGLVLRENAPWKTLGYEVAVATGYCFMGWSRANVGGHALAAHVLADGSIEFMDPNIGERDFANATSFFTWIGGTLGPRYGFDRLTTFEVQTLSRPGM